MQSLAITRPFVQQIMNIPSGPELVKAIQNTFTEYTEAKCSKSHVEELHDWLARENPQFTVGTMGDSYAALACMLSNIESSLKDAKMLTPSDISETPTISESPTDVFKSEPVMVCIIILY